MARTRRQLAEARDDTRMLRNLLALLPYAVRVPARVIVPAQRRPSDDPYRRPSRPPR